MPKEILIIVEGGVIQEIYGIPPDVVVRVKDYDVDGCDPVRLKQDRDGERFLEIRWTHEDSCPADESAQEQQQDARETPGEPESPPHWRCPDCERTLSTSDWTYRDLADRGTPICGDCDTDMELTEGPATPDHPEKAPTAWILVDYTERALCSNQIYDDYEDCAADADRLDNAMIVGLLLADPSSRDENPDEPDDEH